MTSHDMYEPLIIQLSRQINEVDVTNEFFGGALNLTQRTFNEMLEYVKFNYSALTSSVKSNKHSIVSTEEFKFKDINDKKSVLLEAHDDLWDHNLKKLTIEELHALKLTQIFWNENRETGEISYLKFIFGEQYSDEPTEFGEDYNGCMNYSFPDDQKICFIRIKSNYNN